VSLALVVLLGFALALGVAAVLFRRVWVILSLLSLGLSVPTYFLIGINAAGCPRFRSIPFGACNPSDTAVLASIIVWCLAWLGILAIVRRGLRTVSAKRRSP
jgi:hypothetical protein